MIFYCDLVGCTKSISSCTNDIEIHAKVVHLKYQTAYGVKYFEQFKLLLRRILLLRMSDRGPYHEHSEVTVQIRETKMKLIFSSII